MIKIIFIAFTGVSACMLLKRINSQLGFAASIITGIIITVLLYSDANNIIKVFNTFSKGYGISESHIKLLVKVLGISCITQFATSVAEECGEKFIAKKIDLAGKILILSLSLPVLINLLDGVIDLL